MEIETISNLIECINENFLLLDNSIKNFIRISRKNPEKVPSKNYRRFASFIIGTILEKSGKSLLFSIGITEKKFIFKISKIRERFMKTRRRVIKLLSIHNLNPLLRSNMALLLRLFKDMDDIFDAIIQYN